ncbi:hypothetical protein P3X46_014919 [Hevea brasiliensis]|uniref:Uncharacterized protein n=1 Tax=Hevea brasiliensis TaxID=3981 RepID=A0ABQ9LUI2_HEVBR|nr:uncharacterized protein LOC110672813 [Hevea brasiliensis]KAJ9171566.1 hypothetical protein P3X46_014919 [Hevea brasiliensis]
MWGVSPIPFPPFFPFIPRPTKALVSLTVSATSQPFRQRSSPNPNQQKQRIRNHEPENDNQRGAATNQLSGLDVLWAMKRAAAEKNRAAATTNKKNRKRKGLLSADGQREEYAVDYSNVRPLCIKSEWGARLDELEKRLQEISETK